MRFRFSSAKSKVVKVKYSPRITKVMGHHESAWLFTNAIIIKKAILKAHHGCQMYHFYALAVLNPFFDTVSIPCSTLGPLESIHGSTNQLRTRSATSYFPVDLWLNNSPREDDFA